MPLGSRLYSGETCPPGSTPLTNSAGVNSPPERSGTLGEAQPREKVRVFGPMEVHPGYVQDLLGLMRRAGITKEYLVADGRAPSPSVPLFDRRESGRPSRSRLG
jgi:hypothetical protein